MGEILLFKAVTPSVIWAIGIYMISGGS